MTEIRTGHGSADQRSTRPHSADTPRWLAPPPGSELHPGAHTLGRYAAGELSPPRRAEIAAHLAGCPRCRQHLDADEAERRAFLTRRPVSAFLAALEARRPRPWWRRLRWRQAVGAALAAAATIALAIQTGPLSPTPPDRPATTRLKGAYDLSFHVRSGDVIAAGRPGGVYHPGDAIQLRYSSPVAGHLIVISVDSAGAVTAFYDDLGRSLPIEAGVAMLLDGSVVLDEALGPERVIACFSERPLSTAEVIAAGRRALATAGGDPRAVAALAVPCRQVSFLIDKRLP